MGKIIRVLLILLLLVFTVFLGLCGTLLVEADALMIGALFIVLAIALFALCVALLYLNKKL